LKGLEATHRKWVFELQRIERLYGSQDAAEKEVYDTKASHDLAKHSAAEQAATVARLESELAKTEIRAPFSGFIVSRHAEVGQWLIQGGDVVEMADLATVLVRVDLPERCLPFVRVGDEAVVKVEALGQSFTGRVRHVMMQADATARTFPVEIAVPNPGYVDIDGQMIPRRVLEQSAGDESQPGAASNSPGHANPADLQATLLAGGMFARAILQAGPAALTPALPKDAVTMRDGVEFVCMVAPGREEGSLMAIPMPVTTGVDVGNWVAITSGNLAPGMQVVTTGNESILFPSPIEIVKPPGQVAEASPSPADSPPGPETGS
jgi:multidrug efflux pump subunit AcrA (membrane-fusion protein)